MTVSAELDRRFRAAAAAEGLLDVAYDVVETPLGSLLVAASPHGLCRISYDPDPERELDLLARVHGRRVLRTELEEPRRELDEYFAGRREAFELPVDLGPVGEFPRRVLVELSRVPFGSIVTYGELAARVGRPRAARAVGMVMNRNPVPIVLPCHRVVGAGGRLVGYGGGLDRKERLLRLEGALG
jgi:methylated-DNA-[protein]-cysteine S-methyltransferase